MKPFTDFCAECGQEFYSDNHRPGCSREENLEMCGACDDFYLNTAGHSCPLDSESL